MASHSAACHLADFTFVLLVTELLEAGALRLSGPSSIGQLQGHRLGLPSDDCICHLFQRLAIQLCMEGNACTVKKKLLQ